MLLVRPEDRGSHYDLSDPRESECNPSIFGCRIALVKDIAVVASLMIVVFVVKSTKIALRLSHIKNGSRTHYRARPMAQRFKKEAYITHYMPRSRPLFKLTTKQ